VHKLTKSPGKRLLKTRHKLKALSERKLAHAPTKGGKSAAASGSKLALMIAMLRSSKGVSVADLSKATGWQAHSVRGALSGAIGKKLKIGLVSEKLGGVRIYRAAN
jgi:Protein of unknown function (DUF3489)